VSETKPKYTLPTGDEADFFEWFPTADDIIVDHHEERGELTVHVCLQIDREGTGRDVTIAYWANDEAQSLIEDGFVDPRDWRGSVYEHLLAHRVFDEIETKTNAALHAGWQRLVDAAYAFGAENGADHSDGEELVANDELLAATFKGLPYSALDDIVYHNAYMFMCSGSRHGAVAKP
jgi:hypothetical protein